MADISLPVYGGMFDSTEVVESVNGFPRGNKAVDAAFFAKMIASFYADGILAAGDYGQNGFKVSPSSGLTVTVSPGVAWIRGYMAWMQEAQNFVLYAGHSYTIVLRLNTASGEFTLVAAEDASYLPTNTDLIRDLVLAEITVQSGCTSLTSSMITDTRADTGKCGYVTCTVDALQTVPFAENAGSLGGNTSANSRNVWYEVCKIEDMSVRSATFTVTDETWTTIGFRVYACSTQNKFDTSGYCFGGKWADIGKSNVYVGRDGVPVLASGIRVGSESGGYVSVGTTV